MRVLFVRVAGKISGAEIVNINLLRVLSKSKRFKFTFLTNLKELASITSKYKVRTKHINLPIPEIGTKREVLAAFVLSPYILSIYLYQIHRLEKGKRFDLICLQSMTEKIILTLPLRLLGYKVIWYEHGPVFISRIATVIKYAYRLISFYVNKIIVVSFDTRNNLSINGIRKSKIIVNHNGIYPSLFKPLTKFKILSIRRKFHIPVKAKLIGFLGTVTFDKGIRDFISLSKYLLRNNPNYYFVIVGDGPALTWCKCQVSEHEFFRKYIFVGYQSDVRQYLGIFDYFYFPTRHHEGLSMALLESFSMGRIVITRDIGGNREVVRNGYNGFIYRNLSKHIVFKTISQVNRNLKLRARIMRNARNTIIRDFNIKNQARNLRKILLDI